MRISKTTKKDDEFYETMPLTGQHYVYRDDVDEFRGAPDASAQRATAIITLVLVGVVAVALGLLFARGLQIVGGAQPTDTTTSGSLEP